ncbi:sulfate transporter family protein [Talaromyces stipitatus ATCC 10500]|uniref:Sulfate transporter family protein n=1 Tax=Talaromyces stipitatus (strain ATCC 10500 / CBS 375.48 / QM 6759 / NRRL 1006) TaxID=441959 RepID=B8LWI9_TALSN|nr:sulfate transporter family protein [Talaromyces stipitatus ATCC 10500]EED24300.1 sulfate transporter family protein [Talaromyces stipitatus ATCC 10500]
MDIRSGGRGRSNSYISRNDDVLGRTDSNQTDNIISDQNDASYIGSSAAEAPSSPTITKWDSVHSLNNVKTPARSFYHRSFHGSLDPAQYSSQGVREQTAELASLAISDVETNLSAASAPHLNDSIPPGLDIFRPDTKRRRSSHGADDRLSRPTASDLQTSARFEASSMSSTRQLSTSNLTAILRSSPPNTLDNRPETSTSADVYNPRDADSSGHVDEAEEENQPDEGTALIRKRTLSKGYNYGTTSGDIESQPVYIYHRRKNFLQDAYSRTKKFFYVTTHPKSWDRLAIWEEGVVRPVSLLPAVFLGLLLNILDALSYGMILFPLGEAIFSDLGSDGISIYYISTIISQLIFSSGASVFKGGIGSEMIEVVPFFHKMAFMVLNRVGEDNPRAVLATTILSFSLSSILTGVVFFLMGVFKLGSLIGFFPRHILIGCIGGVGWFLVATGVEVSARLPGSLEYNLVTLRHLFQLDTLFLWTIPLALAIILLIVRRFIKSNFLVGGYFILVAVLFYLVKLIARIDMHTLRAGGWVFEPPAASNPWWHFYTLYDFSVVNWSALIETIPAMFALTFFGILHVPINVPALGISTGEDNVSVDRELIAHGITNTVSGLAGSIQNYLVYTNSLLFINSGGDSRLAGIMLAAATTGIMVVGPVIIGYIPILVVGALIFMLGIELMEEALVDTWGKLHRLEYLTVVIIVVTMGVWDFVIGIFVGIILACVNFVVQTSRKSAIRATYSGEFTASTVRRPPIQQKFLKEAGRQTLIIKLSGFLFFGTIVKVEATARGLIDEEAFMRQPIRFLVLDFSRVNGLDFSAAEALTRINRILGKRNVQMLISGLDVEGEVGKSLQNVGLFADESLVQIFEDLNSALEYCENEYLKVFYSRKEALKEQQQSSRASLEVPSSGNLPSVLDPYSHSPRRNYLQQAALSTLREDETATNIAQKWTTFRQPLPLLLQTFQGLTTHQSEDFWYPACAYFRRETYPKDTVLYYEGDEPKMFYLLESGMLRAEYELPQGRYSELIVAGRPCGELPFFGGTPRTATVKVDQDCVAWCLDQERWADLRAEKPEIAQELLMVTLKLTAERMDSITSHVLAIAG